MLLKFDPDFHSENLTFVPQTKKGNRMKRLFTVLLGALAIAGASAQCEVGELEFTMDLYTDNWGYEVYWEIVPEGNACGTGTILSGGNAAQVGCNGGGQQDAGDGEGYESNTVINIAPFCLTMGQAYDLYFVDDYGDGGLTFEIYEEGELFVVLAGSGEGSMWTFTPGFSPIPDYSSPCDAEPIMPDGTPIMLNNTFAASTMDEPSPEGFDCAAYGYWCEGSVTKSVWALATIPTGGSYIISTCNSGTVPDTQLAVYLFEDCADYSTYTLISANDDVPGGCADANGYASTCYIACLEPGTQILIQTDGFYGESGDIYLTLTPYDGEAEANPIVYDSACPESKGEAGSGAAIAQISGWGIDYTVLWTGPNGFQSNDLAIFELSSGTYNYTATNACGSSFSGSVEVGAATPFTAYVTVTPPTCATASNGSLQMNLTGGTAPYEYEWTGPGGFLSNDQNPTGMMAGSYLLLATDENGCVFSQFFSVTAGTGIPVSLGANTTICLNQSVTLNGPEGVAYNWSTGAATQSITFTGEELGVGEHTIILNVSDNSGCNGAGSVTITVDNCIGVDEIGLGAMAVYPNPAADKVHISGLPTTGVLLSLSASDGRILLQKQTNGNASELLETGHLARGVYILTLSHPSGMISTHKLILE